MALALLLAYLLAANVTRPIKALAAGTEAFAKGQLDQRVRVKSRNELGALADTFNAMADQLQNYIQRLSAAVTLNSELFIGTVKALAEAIDEKDPYTRGHSERVNQYAVLLAKQMGLSKKEIYEVHISSLFHDIGKIGIEDKILRKPAALTDEEYTVMKQHPNKGYQMLSKIRAMKDIIPGIRFHHERWDGSGYPMGLKADQIPLPARIVAVGEASRHQKAFEGGAISYEEFCARDAAHWKGMPESRLRAITDAIPYRPGVRECAELLRQENLLVGVISTGLTILIERVNHDLDLAYAIANRLVARHGILTGEVKVNVEHGRKGEAVDLFCGQFGVDYREVITVGDSDGDISMFEHSGFSVAFNPASEKTARAATVVGRGDSLLSIINLLPMDATLPQ